MLELAGFVVGVVGLAPTVVVALEFIREQLPLRRALGFRSPDGVELLVTTSATGISGVGPPQGPRAKRDLIPSGDLAGVAELCSMLARVYPRRPYVITPSSRKQSDGRRDQFVVGGPVHNRYAAQLVCGRMADAGPDTPVVFDADRRFVKIDEQFWGPDLDLRFEEDVPQTEYALVVLTGIRRFGMSQRVVVAAGLTTYGTHAAAHFVVHELAGVLAGAGLRRRPNVCILIKAALVNGQPYHIDVLAHLPVPHLGSWS